MDVQASLLVLHDPGALDIALPDMSAPAATSSAAASPAAQRRAPARQLPRAPQQKLPASTWIAMSALAGAPLLPQAAHLAR